MVEVEPGHFAACHHTDKTAIVSDVQAEFDEFAAAYLKSDLQGGVPSE